MKSNLELIARATRAVLADRDMHMVDAKTILISELKDEIISQNISQLQAIDQMQHVLKWFNKVNGRNVMIIENSEKDVA